MTNAFASEWVKLRRRNLLAGAYVAITAVAVLFTVLIFARAGHADHDRREFVTLAQLAQPSGLVHGVSRAGTLLGLVALCVAAAQVASEYTNGTLRNLLVRQPRRGRLLAGKYLAVLTFMVGAVAAATAGGVAAAFVMAHVRAIPTSAWTSAPGLQAFGQALANTAIAVCGYATLGLVLGVVMRSPVSAIAVGVIYVLPFETILAAVVSGTARWLPGQLLDAISQGGTSTARYGPALLTAIVYLAAAGLVAGSLFARRDVTA